MKPLITPLAKFFGFPLAILSFSMFQAAAFSIGDHVQCTANLNVHTTPSTSGTLVTTEASGSLGTIASGPTSANGYTWWNIAWNNGYSGWSIQDYLQIVSTTPPTAQTQSASSISTGSAQLNGYANPNGYTTTIYFQYGTTTSYGSTTVSGNIGTGAGNYGYSISGLSAGTTYHFRIVASNSGGTTYGNDVTFITLSQPAPAAQTQAASSITISSATLNGFINPNGASTAAYFQYGTTTSYGNTTISGNFGTTAQNIGTAVTGLSPNTTYHFRIVASNSGGTTYGGDVTFTTSSQPAPTIQTLAASSIADNSAQLNGSINPNGASTTAYFQYGTTTSYGNTSLSGNFGTTAQSISTTVTGLPANTLYHYRIVAYNSGGTNYGNDVTFATTSTTAVAQTQPATSVTSDSATLNGTITPPNGVSTTFYFQYGTTSYTTTSASGNTTIVINASDPITGLSPNTTYHYRIVASNSNGTTYGSDVGFTTASTGNAPSIAMQPQSQTVQIGGNVTLIVMASGVTPLRYQWQFNGFNLSGATNATLTLYAVIAANGGNYSVVVSNPYGFVNSTPASLAVYGVGAAILHGHVTDTTGTPLSDTTVSLMDGTLKFVALTNTDAQGYYQILPALHTGTYAVSAGDPTHQPSQRAFTLSANTAQQDFQLKPMPTLPDAQQVQRASPVSYTVDGLMGSQLLIYNGTSFGPITYNNLPSTNLMMIVMTHGWVIGSPDSSVTNTLFDRWPTNMAALLQSRGITPATVNIVAWDWRYAATSPLPQPGIPADRTPAQGVALGEALQHYLGANYSKPLHFLGHSLGTLVNAAAINYLHGEQIGTRDYSPTPWQNNLIQVTLFDQAWIAQTVETVEDIDSIYYYNYQSPLPQRFTWADNYKSLVGLGNLPNAINVNLQKGLPNSSDDLNFNPLDLFGAGEALSDAHGYPIDWYGMSILNPTDANNPFGFKLSYEYENAPSLFWPIDSVGTEYYQSPLNNDELALEPVSGGSAFLYSDQVLQTTVETIQYTGGVGVQIWDATQNTTSSLFNYVNGLAASGEQAVVNAHDSVSLDLTLSTTSLQPSGNLAKPELLPQGENGSSSGSEPYPIANDDGQSSPPMAWLPIQIPTNTEAMTFDFKISGNPMDDSLVSGIGTNNLFSLQAKYIPTNTFSTSRFIDVSALAGTTNELFFGFLGDTSTNAALEINNIRFYGIGQQPSLDVEVTNNTVVLSWPVSANSYVLETTDNLTVTNSWLADTNMLEINGNSYMVIEPIASGSRFYRLGQQ